MDGFIYVYDPPRSSGQRRYTERRVQEQRLLRRRAAEEEAAAAAALLKDNPNDRPLPSNDYNGSSKDKPHKKRPSDESGVSAAANALTTTTTSTDDKTKPHTANTPAIHLERVGTTGEKVPHRQHSKRTTSASSPTNAKASERMDGQSAVSLASLATSLTLLSSTSSPPPLPISHADLLSQPFELLHGRRYLRDLPYPLPVDLPELHRQNLRTLIGCSVFGRPVCSPVATRSPPRRVLELGCGSGYWSAMCHEYFTSLGHPNVEFVGLDVAPLAPDFERQGHGMNWKFVQHDLRRLPLPFPNEDFDMVVLKDLSLTLPFTGARSLFERILDECVRLLRGGGVLEIWDGEHLTRSILPHPPPVAGTHRKSRELASRTGTFLIAPGTPFAPAQNKYLNQASDWIKEAIDLRKLPSTPCARIAQILYQEPDMLGDVDYKRVAIPLGEQRWERDDPGQQQIRSEGSDGKAADPHDSFMSTTSADGRQKSGTSALTPDQLAIRQTALLTVVRFIESMEPLLQDVSGMNAEEWSHWWSAMMADLMDPDSQGAINGECLEIGAWWCIKIAAS